MSAAHAGDPGGRAAPRRGAFVTVEGIDGCGKSTHVAAIAARLHEAAAETDALPIVTREPGGTPLAEALRALMLAEPMDPVTEALLAFAARRDHVRLVVAPALAAGRSVVCDRFADSTFAYQGAGRGVDAAWLGALERGMLDAGGADAVGPDLTLWFDVPPARAAARRAADASRRGADRFEREDEAFFTRVRAGYAARAAAAPRRIVRIDADAPIDAVADGVRVAIDAFLARHDAGTQGR